MINKIELEYSKKINVDDEVYFTMGHLTGELSRKVYSGIVVRVTRLLWWRYYYVLYVENDINKIDVFTDDVVFKKKNIERM